MGLLQRVSQYFCGFPHRGSPTSPHLLLSWLHLLLPYHSLCWGAPRGSVRSQAQLAPLWYQIACWLQGGDTSHFRVSLLALAPPCAAKRPHHCCPGGVLPFNPHFSTLVASPPLTLGNRRSPVPARWRLEAGGAHHGRGGKPPAKFRLISTLTTTTGSLITITFSRREQAVILLQLQRKKSR